MSTLSLTIGATFNGRYRVVRCMAHGGMGAVYEVIHLETERRRALKVMLPHLVQSPELRERFRQESRVAGKIQSAYIVEVFDAGTDDQTGMPFLVMELLKGEDLGKRLERLKRLPAKEVVKYLQQTASALDKTHAANIVHRDLKPETLFLHEREDEEPCIKVLDFGIAKIVADQESQAKATRSVGTPLYMAPEQFKQGSQVSPATDIYALGMMAYTLLVGGPYWEDEQRANDNVFAFVASVMHGPKEKATVRAGRRGVVLAPAFDTWFSKVTNAAPEQRYASAKAAIAALAEALGMQAPEASRVIDKTALLGQAGARIDTVKMMPDIRAALKAGETPGAALAPAAPPPRPPLASAAPTEQLAPTPILPEPAPSLPALEPAAPPVQTTGAAQAATTGVGGLASTRPTETQAKRNHAPMVAIAGVLALVGIGGVVLGGRSGKTEEVKPVAASNSTPEVTAMNTQTAALPPMSSASTQTAASAPTVTATVPTSSAGATSAGATSSTAAGASATASTAPGKPTSKPQTVQPKPTSQSTTTSKPADPHSKISL